MWGVSEGLDSHGGMQAGTSCADSWRESEALLFGVAAYYPEANLLPSEALCIRCLAQPAFEIERGGGVPPETWII